MLIGGCLCPGSREPGGAVPPPCEQFSVLQKGVQAMVTNFENLCLVCGYEMEEPPRDYNICPSCGTEFGVHDVNAPIADLRAAWIQSGPRWWSTSDPQPENWNPPAQLEKVAAPIASAPVFLGGGDPRHIVISSSGIAINSLTETWLKDWPDHVSGQLVGRQF